jgi:hypothetical protein
VGHNRPPLDERFTGEEIAEMRAATNTATAAIETDNPDALKVAQQSNVLVRILKSMAKGTGELWHKFVDGAVDSAAKAFGGAVGVGLAFHIGGVLNLAKEWFFLLF